MYLPRTNWDNQGQKKPRILALNRILSKIRKFGWTRRELRKLQIGRISKQQLREIKFPRFNFGPSYVLSYQGQPGTPKGKKQNDGTPRILALNIFHIWTQKAIWRARKNYHLRIFHQSIFKEQQKNSSWIIWSGLIQFTLGMNLPIFMLPDDNWSEPRGPSSLEGKFMAKKRIYI